MTSIMLVHNGKSIPYPINLSNINFADFKQDVKQLLNLVDIKIPTLQCKLKKGTNESAVLMDFFKLKPNTKVLVLGEAAATSLKQLEANILKAEEEAKAYEQFRRPLQNQMDQNLQRLAERDENWWRNMKSTNSEKDSYMFKWHCIKGNFVEAEKLYRNTSHKIDLVNDEQYVSDCLCRAVQSGNLKLVDYLVTRTKVDWLNLIFRSHRYSHSPLMYYIMRYGRIEIFEYFFKTNRDTLLKLWCSRYTDEQRNLLRHWIIEEVRSNFFEYIVKIGDDVENVDEIELKVQFQFYINLVVIANLTSCIEFGRIECVRYFLDYLTKQEMVSYHLLQKMVFGCINVPHFDATMAYELITKWKPNERFTAEEEKRMHTFEFELKVKKHVLFLDAKVDDDADADDDDGAEGENPNLALCYYATKILTFHDCHVPLDLVAEHAFNSNAGNLAVLNFLVERFKYNFHWNHYAFAYGRWADTHLDSLTQYFVENKVLTEDVTADLHLRFKALFLKHYRIQSFWLAKGLIHVILQHNLLKAMTKEEFNMLHSTTQLIFYEVQYALEQMEKRAKLVSKAFSGDIESIERLQNAEILLLSSTTTTSSYLSNSTYYTFPLVLAQMITYRMCGTYGFNEAKYISQGIKLMGATWAETYNNHLLKQEQDKLSSATSQKQEQAFSIWRN